MDLDEFKEYDPEGYKMITELEQLMAPEATTVPEIAVETKFNVQD
jgi:hypothetical protein